MKRIFFLAFALTMAFMANAQTTETESQTEEVQSVSDDNVVMEINFTDGEIVAYTDEAVQAATVAVSAADMGWPILNPLFDWAISHICYNIVINNGRVYIVDGCKASK